MSLEYSPGAPDVDLQGVIGDHIKVTTDPSEKKLGRLQKKLQQIQSLKERLAAGEKLESNQVSSW